MKYRLPTEAEWEYACRAGSAGHRSFGDGIQRAGDHTWFGSISGRYLHPVGQKLSNAWGIFDMHGNAQEFCEDFFENPEYAKDQVTDPQGPLSGTLHFTRGGHEGSPEVIIRSAFRFAQPPTISDNMHGFQVVASSAAE